MASTLSVHFTLLVLLSLSIQPHARESKFFTKVIHYLSNSAPVPAPAQAQAPGPVLVVEPVLAPGLAPVLAPAPAEEEYGYGLYGKGSSEFSTVEESKNETPVADEFTSEKDAPFEKLLSGESYSPNSNGYSSSVNENNGYNNNENGYNQNMYNNNYNGNGYNNNGNGYSSSTNKNNYYKTGSYNPNGYYNNGNGYSTAMNQNNGYNTESYSQNGYNNYDNRFSSSMNQNNGYNTESYSQNGYNNNNDNGYMTYENENNGYSRSKDENNNNGYVTEQQGMSDTRFLENGKYAYELNNNENDHEKSYDEEVSDNGEGYYRNNEGSKYEFDTMEEAERQSGYVKGQQREEYVP